MAIAYTSCQRRWFLLNLNINYKNKNYESQKLLDCICRKITISNFNRIREKWKYFRILERTKIYKLTLKAKNMYANFIVTNGKLSKLDKFIIVYNLDGLNEIFNIGFCFSKKKIQRQNDIVGIWKVKQRKNIN